MRRTEITQEVDNHEPLNRTTSGTAFANVLKQLEFRACKCYDILYNKFEPVRAKRFRTIPGLRESTATCIPTTPTTVISMASCPVDHKAKQADSSSSTDQKNQCPVKHDGGSPSNDEINPANMMPNISQEPAVGQPFTLSTDRVISTIPKADLKGENWVYPSEQMFFNAMVRKGWKWTEEELKPEDMKHIIAIHNRNNEEAWQEVLKWEALHARQCGSPKLVSFRGRAQDFSPRARIRHWMGYELPFDRHDWVIDRCGRHVRYVIDYYGCEPTGNNSAPIYLDVRPAMDSFTALWDRMKVTVMRWTTSSS